MKHSFAKYSLVALLVLSACESPAPPYPNPGTAENLIDVSTETMSMGIGSNGDVSKLASMVRDERPSSAQLQCSLSNSTCTNAKNILERNSVPVEISPQHNNKVVLVYERVVTRDCDQRFRDNMSGTRNRNHAAFGCSVASNMVRMVSDKNQFTNPNLLDFPDAEKGNESYSGYLKTSAQRQVKEAVWSTTGSK